MNALRSVLLIALALCTLLCFASCGDSKAQEKEENDSSVQSVAESSKEESESEADTPVSETDSEDASSVIDDGKVTYTATVVDENGAAIAGAMVQICKEACMPTSTDESGVATWRVAEDDYKVSFLALPAGYTYSGEETEFYFEDGQYDLTITLNSVGTEASEESVESSESAQ